MSRLILMLVVLAAVGVLAFALRRRQQAEAPTQPRAWPVPTQLDRRDFARPDAPFLVVVFTSETCGNCERVVSKTRILEAVDVAYEEVPYQSDKARHDRYGVEAVPMVLVADAVGVVQKSFVGDVTAIDLWGAVATVRDPSSEPQSSDHSQHDH